MNLDVFSIFTDGLREERKRKTTLSQNVSGVERLLTLNFCLQFLFDTSHLNVLYLDGWVKTFPRLTSTVHRVELAPTLTTYVTPGQKFRMCDKQLVKAK